MIHVRELTKTYADLRRGQVVALSGLTFDAFEGQTRVRTAEDIYTLY